MTRPDDHFGAAPWWAQDCSTCDRPLEHCTCHHADSDPTPPHGVARPPVTTPS